jgi:hypothetical protein
MPAGTESSERQKKLDLPGSPLSSRRKSAGSVVGTTTGKIGSHTRNTFQDSTHDATTTGSWCLDD